MSLLHDVFLGANVLLLPRVHDVSLFQNLHGKRFGLVTFELHLSKKNIINQERETSALSVVNLKKLHTQKSDK